MNPMPGLWEHEQEMFHKRSVPALEVTPVVTDLLAAHAPIAIGVSGGKDSTATAFATSAFLDEIGHRGPRLLIHSHLGRVEWKDSLPSCQRLADRLRLELVVVERQAGDLMDRWLVRWRNNVERYVNLQCVKLILPWSMASMRFCTKELKTVIICNYLVRRFPGSTILSVVGLRRQESSTRAKAPVCVPNVDLTSAKYQTCGYNWHPLLGWLKEDVLRYHDLCDFPLHEAYLVYGTSRVSCCFCVLSSWADLIASSACPDNHHIYREMVELEIISAFSFQESRWLGDVAPHLLSEETHVRLAEAKRRAALRQAIEARIPKHLLYVKGWPTVMPSRDEAILLSDVRCRVAEIMEMAILYTDPDAILGRYAELMAINVQRQQKATKARGPIETVQQEISAHRAIDHIPDDLVQPMLFGGAQ